MVGRGVSDWSLDHTDIVAVPIYWQLFVLFAAAAILSLITVRPAILRNHRRFASLRIRGSSDIARHFNTGTAFTAVALLNDVISAISRTYVSRGAAVCLSKVGAAVSRVSTNCSDVDVISGRPVTVHYPAVLCRRLGAGFLRSVTLCNPRAMCYCQDTLA